jgi:nucleoside-diphosphate-sugar epimerase
MPAAFITGAVGFIGGYTVREFIERGWHVFALVHRKTSSELDSLAASGRVTIIHGDLREFSSVEDELNKALAERGVSLDAIVHCAGRASDVGRREEFRRTNFEPIQRLCELTERMNVPRFVFVSTTDVYGMRDFHGERESDLPLMNNARNPYPEFKIASEEWIRKTLPPERYSIIRPAAVWGVGDPTLSPRIVSFLKSSPWIINFGRWRGENRWPLAHVRNVATAIFLASTLSEGAGSAINVIDSERTTIDEFYRILAAIYLPSKKLKSVTLPLWAGKVFGSIVSLISNASNLDRPFTDPSIYAVYSVSCDLDFGNETLLHLLDLAGRKLLTRDEGVEELRASFKQ